MVGLDPLRHQGIKAAFPGAKGPRRRPPHLHPTMIDQCGGLLGNVTHIMVNGRFAATQYNKPEELKAHSLEDLFFAITEGGKPS